MAANDPCIVVLQLTGGNDYINTMIPYNNPLYRDNRPAVGIADDKIIHLDNDYGIPDYMAPMKKFWDDKKLAVLHGVGFKDSPRSHFRAMDIWHTCEPEKVGTEGWLGRVARELRLGLGEQRLIPNEVGLRLLQRGCQRPLIDREQQIALLHEIAFVNGDLLQYARDLRADGDCGVGLYVANGRDVDRYVFLRHLGDHDWLSATACAPPASPAAATSRAASGGVGGTASTAGDRERHDQTNEGKSTEL